MPIGFQPTTEPPPAAPQATTPQAAATQATPAVPAPTTSSAQPRYKPEHLYVFGGIAIGVMIGLLVGVAAWSYFRSRRRQAEADAKQKQRLNIKHVGQDAWAESGDRMRTPSVRELNKQHAPKNANPDHKDDPHGDSGPGAKP